MVQGRKKQKRNKMEQGITARCFPVRQSAPFTTSLSAKTGSVKSAQDRRWTILFSSRQGDSVLIGTLIIISLLVHGIFYIFLPIYSASDREMVPSTTVYSRFYITGQPLKGRQLEKVGKCQRREAIGHANGS